jgi:ferrous-iron efflux pump FieF
MARMTSADSSLDSKRNTASPKLDGRARGLMRRASAASVSVAAALIALKVWAWLATGSVAMLSSLVDSFLDLVASVITLLAVRVALSPADREHRFGHGKSEGIANLIQALIVIASALYIAVEAVKRLLAPSAVEQPAVGIAVMLVSLVLTGGLVLFQRHVVRQTDSLAVAADAMHYRSDILSNVAVLVAILVSVQLGWYVFDPVLGLVIAGLILYGARNIALEALNILLDRELPSVERKRIKDVVFSHPAVLGVHDVRTRSSGSAQFIQLHLELEGTLMLSKVHTICDEVELKLQTAFPRAEILIHADPYGVEEIRDPF